MTKKTCPVCQKTFTNLKRHLARRYKCKPPKEISKEISEEKYMIMSNSLMVMVKNDQVLLRYLLKHLLLILLMKLIRMVLQLNMTNLFIVSN